VVVYPQVVTHENFNLLSFVIISKVFFFLLVRCCVTIEEGVPSRTRTPQRVLTRTICRSRIAFMMLWVSFRSSSRINEILQSASCYRPDNYSGQHNIRRFLSSMHTQARNTSRLDRRRLVNKCSRRKNLSRLRESDDVIPACGYMKGTLENVIHFIQRPTDPTRFLPACLQHSTRIEDPALLTTWTTQDRLIRFGVPTWWHRWL